LFLNRSESIAKAHAYLSLKSRIFKGTEKKSCKNGMSIAKVIKFIGKPGLKKNLLRLPETIVKKVQIPQIDWRDSLLLILSEIAPFHSNN
jgi:hypothetical protein